MKQMIFSYKRTGNKTNKAACICSRKGPFYSIIIIMRDGSIQRTTYGDSADFLRYLLKEADELPDKEYEQVILWIIDGCKLDDDDNIDDFYD